MFYSSIEAFVLAVTGTAQGPYPIATTDKADTNLLVLRFPPTHESQRINVCAFEDAFLSSLGISSKMNSFNIYHCR